MPDSVPMIRMSDVQQTAVHWLWYPYIPFGKLTIEEKIFSMYAKGMTTRQISDTLEDIYGFEASEGFISDVTDKIMPQIEDWQNRPLSEVYPVL